MRELLLVRIQQGYPKERKIKNIVSEYRDLEIGIKVIQFKSFQLWTILKRFSE